MGKYVLFIKRDGFDFYIPETKVNYTCALSPKAVQDLEVLDDAQLNAEISNFIQENKILPGTCDILISDSLVFAADYLKELRPQSLNQKPLQPPQQPVDQQLEIQEKIKQFVREVPFETVASKSIQITNGSRVVTINKDFYTAFTISFKQQNIIIVSVVPVCLITGSLQNQPALTGDLIQLIERNPDILRQHNFLLMNVVPVEKKNEVKSTKTDEKSSTKNQTYMLVSVFGVLLVVLAIMVYKNVLTHPKPKPAVVQSSNVPVQSQPTIPSSSSAALSVSPAAILIDIQSPLQSNLATAFKSELTTAGFTSLTQSQTTNQTTGVIVMFDTSVPQAIQQQITTALSTSYPSLRPFQNTIGQNKVIITVGNGL